MDIYQRRLYLNTIFTLKKLTFYTSFFVDESYLFFY